MAPSPGELVPLAPGEAASVPAGAQLRIVGLWSGSLLPTAAEEGVAAPCTVEQVREQLSLLSGVPAAGLRLISAGRTLKDRDALGEAVSLAAAGVRPGSKLLLTKEPARNAASAPPGPAPEAQGPAPGADPAEESAERLRRIRAAAEALALRSQKDKGAAEPRHGSGRSGNHRPGRGRARQGQGGRRRMQDEEADEQEPDLELLDQNGRPLEFPSELDRRSLVTGLLLHSRARAFLRQEDYGSALELLRMAEDALGICDQSLLEHVDNPGLLLLDEAWCHFMLRDSASLSGGRLHLDRVWSALRKAHGEDMSRMRRLQGGFQPELALYLRLHLLEGALAFHAGNLDEARRRFSSSSMLLRQLQVADEAMVSLAAMGFTVQEARRGLRMAGGEVAAAAEFVLQQREWERRQRDDDRRRRNEKRARRLYGATISGDTVDLAALEQLCSISGREKEVVAEALRQENNIVERALDALLDPQRQEQLQEAARGKQDGALARPDSSLALALLLSEGFTRAQVEGALSHACGDLDVARLFLLKSLESRGEGSGGNTSDTRVEPPHETEGIEDVEMSSVSDESIDDEAETDITSTVTGDPFEEYDIDVRREEEVLHEYLALMGS